VTNLRIRGPLAALLIAPLALSACSHSDTKAVKPAAESPSPVATTTSPPPPPKPSLLSGRVGKVDGPVYAVKVDNTKRSHPQQGLTKADVVYIEQVEGGVTRLAAVFSSEYPKLVGPVRSARITDIDLLRQYGTVGLIYSGSNGRLVSHLVDAPLKLVSFDNSRLGYTRALNRPMPYDVIGDFAALRKRAGKVSTPKHIGYTFGDVPTTGGKPAASIGIRFPFARVDAKWSAAKKRWLLSMDGVKDMSVEDGQLGPTTFVVQYSTLTASVYHDVNGANTPLTKTVGHGAALFFRDGKEFKGTWTRAKASEPTKYKFADGSPAVFAGGQIWVALLGRGRPVTVN
jgi:Protein of unknown function (DUF3048) N-terminal domain/Protein of unknown function (DUF3048) C-terminal domain